MTFRTTLFLAGTTATGIVVPPEVVESLGAGKRPPVTVTINGFTYRSTIAVMGGEYMLPVSAERRQGAGISAGEEIEVTLELDTAPREVQVPEDLAAALAADLEANTFFQSLSYSNQLKYALSVEGAKTPETRQRRVEKAIADLRAGKKI